MNSVVERLKRLARHNIPTTAFFEVTHRCNASCRYCYITDKSTAQDLPTDKVTAIIDKLFDSGILDITITGGDPFCRTDIKEILKAVFSKDFFSVVVMTNGTLVQAEELALLVANRSKLRKVCMTVFSHLPEENDNYFGVDGALSKILSTADGLKKNGIEVRLALNVVDFNVTTFVESKRYFQGLGYDIPFHYPPVLYSSKGDTHYLDYLVSKEFYREFLDQLTDDQISKYVENVLKKKAWRRFCPNVCHSITIDHQGNIRPCIPFLGMNLGNVLDRAPLSEILGRNATRNRILEIESMQVPQCDSCRYGEVCSMCPGPAFDAQEMAIRPFPAKCNSVFALEEAAIQRGLI